MAKRTNYADKYEMVSADDAQRWRMRDAAERATPKPANDNERFPTIRFSFWLFFAYFAFVAFVLLMRQANK